MGCAVCCKVLLILINIVTMILSLAFIGIGVLLVFVVDIFLKDAFESAQEDALTRGYVITGSASELKEFPLLYEIGVALLVFGALLFVLSWLAWCGSCCASCCRILLLVFSIILIVLMLAEVIVFSLFLVKDSALHKELKKEVQDKIDSDFDESSGNTFTAAMIIIHREADCCGMEGVADFGAKTHVSCEPANEQTGCYDEMQDVIQDNKLYAGLVVAALLALQVIEVICAIVIYKDSSLKISPF